MNWLDKQTWKNCFVSTFLCFAGCSIGTMGTLFYLTDYHWLYVFLVSFLTGLLIGFISITFWKIAFRKIALKEAIKSSFRMSIISMTIMIITENLVMQLMTSKHHSHEIHGTHSENLLPMFLAMGIGFLLALPYNYYILTKTGKACH